MPSLLPPGMQKHALQVILILWITGLLPWTGSTKVSAAADTARLPAAIQKSRFVAYTPRGFSVIEGKVAPASRSGIKEDLEILRPYFDGVITYSANNGVEGVAEIASELKYRAMIMGIWDPTSEIEINNVLRAYREYPTLVAAVIIGNEGIYAKRYAAEDVQQAITIVKKTAPNLAVTTSEPFFIYFMPEHADFFKSHDLLMPNIHPVFEKWFRPNELGHGVTMVINVAVKLQTEYRLPVLIKETGLPSGEPAQGYSPAHQARFWGELGKRLIASPSLAFAYFEAFDTPWKPALMAAEFPGNHASEAYWGLFTSTGQAKEIIELIPRVTAKAPATTP